MHEKMRGLSVEENLKNEDINRGFADVKALGIRFHIVYDSWKESKEGLLSKSMSMLIPGS